MSVWQSYQRPKTYLLELADTALEPGIPLVLPKSVEAELATALLEATAALALDDSEAEADPTSDCRRSMRSASTPTSAKSRSGSRAFLDGARIVVTGRGDEGNSRFGDMQGVTELL